MELLALERLLSERGDRGLWAENRVEQSAARERDPVPADAVADDQPR